MIKLDNWLWNKTGFENLGQGCWENQNSQCEEVVVCNEEVVLKIQNMGSSLKKTSDSLEGSFAIVLCCNLFPVGYSFDPIYSYFTRDHFRGKLNLLNWRMYDFKN